MKTRAVLAVGLALAAVAGVAACAPEPPPAPTTTTTTTTLPTTTETVGFACNDDALNLSFTGQAPATVQQNLPYLVNLSVVPAELPTASGAFPITSFQNLRLRIAVPAGAVLAALPTLTGGSNLGTGVPSVSILPSGAVELLIPGPLTAGATVTFPTLTLPLVAVGLPGTVLETKLAGSGMANPSLTFTVGVQPFLPGSDLIVDVVQNCFDYDGDSVLTTTTITGLPF